MATQGSFKEILKEKMATTEGAEALFAPREIDQDPLHLAFLMGRIGRLNQQPLQKHYTKAYPRPVPKPRPAHILNELQAQSFAFFRNIVADIPEGFTMTELKKAFRAAAKITHPDHGGSCDQFFALRNHFSILSTVLSSS